MNKKRKIISLSVIVFICLAGIIFYYQTGKRNPDFYESNNGAISLTSFQKNNINNDIAGSRQNIITETVQKVSPAVVGINVTEIRQYRDVFSMDPFFRVLGFFQCPTEQGTFSCSAICSTNLWSVMAVRRRL